MKRVWTTLAAIAALMVATAPLAVAQNHDGGEAIVGTVTDAVDGAPIEDVEVLVEEVEGVEAPEVDVEQPVEEPDLQDVTDEDGVFAIDDIDAGTFKVTAHSEAHAAATAAVTVENSQVEEIAFELEPAQAPGPPEAPEAPEVPEGELPEEGEAIVGTVTDAVDGAPIEDVEVLVEEVEDVEAPEVDVEQPVEEPDLQDVTDEDGVFVIDEIDAGTFKVTAEADAHGVATAAVAVQDDQIQQLDFELQPVEAPEAPEVPEGELPEEGEAIVGTVTDAVDGAPIEEVEVLVEEVEGVEAPEVDVEQPVEEPDLQDVTDEDGVFVIDEIDAGTFKVTADAEAHVATTAALTVEDGQVETIDLELEPAEAPEDAQGAESLVSELLEVLQDATEGLLGEAL